MIMQLLMITILLMIIMCIYIYIYIYIYMYIYDELCHKYTCITTMITHRRAARGGEELPRGPLRVAVFARPSSRAAAACGGLYWDSAMNVVV